MFIVREHSTLAHARDVDALTRARRGDARSASLIRLGLLLTACTALSCAEVDPTPSSNADEHNLAAMPSGGAAVSTAAGVAPTWANVAPLATTNQDGRLTLKVVTDTEWVWVLVESERKHEQTEDKQTYNLWFDTVPDQPLPGKRRGLRSPSWISRSGGDKLLHGVAGGGWYGLHQYDNADPAGREWGAMPVVKDAVLKVDKLDATSGVRLQFKVSRESLGYDESVGVGIGFEWTLGNVSKQRVPDGGAFARVVPAGTPAFDTETCSYVGALDRTLPKPRTTCQSFFGSGRRPVPTSEKPKVGKGMIIPAYLPVEDKNGWAKLESLVPARAAHEPALNYWVAVNGPFNGPPKSETEWKNKENWEHLADVPGVKVFGYVHAMCGPKDHCTGPSKLRPLVDVMNEITDWVCALPKLSGIWIDEYYPKYELTSTADDVIVPDLKEDGLLTPINRCFLDEQGALVPSVQVEPDGGYFDHLTGWIRQNYGSLALIGNVGAPLDSNLHKYAGLVDVLVSYEKSHLNATAKLDEEGEPNKHKLGPPLPGVPQLALFHGTEEDDLSIIGAARDLGYTHVYATDAVYKSEESNPWGKLASYLDEEPALCFDGDVTPRSATTQSPDGRPDAPQTPGGLIPDDVASGEDDLEASDNEAAELP